MPEHPCKDTAHLGIRQTGTNGVSLNTAVGGQRISSRLANAIPWTDMKWLECRSLVVCIDLITKPAFWYELVGVAEVVLGSIGRPVVDSYCSLGSLVSISVSQVMSDMSHISRDEMTVDDISFWKCLPGQRNRHWRVESQALFYHSVEIGQSSHRSKCDVAFALKSAADFVADFFQSHLVRQEVVSRSRQECCSSFGPCYYQEPCL